MRQDAADGQDRENLTITFFRLGAITSNLKYNEQSVVYLEKARAVLTELGQAEPKNQAYKMHLGRIYVRYGFIKSNQNDWQNAVAEYKKAAVVFQEITRFENQNKVAWRYLAGQYINIAEIYAGLPERGDKENQTTRRGETIENYERALEILLQLQAQNSLTEYDRKSIEKTQIALQTLAKK